MKTLRKIGFILFYGGFAVMGFAVLGQILSR